MVLLNEAPQLIYDTPEVHNTPCQHAFTMVGIDQVFAVHMTQYHTEKHKYQLIMHIDLPKGVLDEYRRQRELYPDDTFVLCNLKKKKVSIPQLGGGIRDTFTGAIYQGFRPPAGPPPENWFPWNDDDTLPIAGLEEIEVKVRRVVLFRPFFHNETPPPFANYYLFGAPAKRPGGPPEAHMTNLQTGSLLTGKFEPPLYGLDVDHVMSLQAMPEWMSTDMLIAGIPVSIPCIPRIDPDTGGPKVLPKPPFEPGQAVDVLYRGVQPRAVVAGNTFYWGSAVCCSEPLVPPKSPDHSFLISIMPKKYWV